ncbi:MAG: hypothetical protein ACKOEC_08835 [Acidimicrobiia bacterium]
MENGDEAPLRAAQQALEDPRTRLAAEPFWFWGQDGPGDPPLSADWLNQASGDLHFGVIALEIEFHDIAVQAFLNASAPDRLSDRDRRARWERAVTAWSPLLADGVIDRWLLARAVELDDPRLTTAEVDRIRASVVEVLASPIVALAEDDVDAGNADAVGGWCRLVDTLCRPVQGNRATAILRPLGERAVVLVESAAQNVRSALFGDGPTGGSDAKARVANAMAGLGLMRTAVTVARAVPDGDGLRGARVGDTLASALRATSIYSYNELDDVLGAASMLDEAIREAKSPSLKEQLAADHSTINELVGYVREHDRLVAAIRERIRQRNFAEAKDLLADLLNQAFSNTRMQHTDNAIKQVFRELQEAEQAWARSMPGLVQTYGKRLLGWGIAGLVAFAAIHSCGSSQPARTSSGLANPTAVSRSVPSSSGSVRVSSAVKVRLDAMEREIDDGKAKAERLKRQLDSLELDIDLLKSSLDSTQSRYAVTGAPSSVVDQFDRDRARYNRLITQHPDLLDQYRRVVSEVNQKVYEHNTLLREGR